MVYLLTAIATDTHALCRVVPPVLLVTCVWLPACRGDGNRGYYGNLFPLLFFLPSLNQIQLNKFLFFLSLSLASLPFTPLPVPSLPAEYTKPKD